MGAQNAPVIDPMVVSLAAGSERQRSLLAERTDLDKETSQTICKVRKTSHKARKRCPSDNVVPGRRAFGLSSRVSDRYGREVKTVLDKA